jgi:hypothetical protein
MPHAPGVDPPLSQPGDEDVTDVSALLDKMAMTEENIVYSARCFPNSPACI